MIDLKKELIDYLYDFNVRSDLTIEELAEDINAMYEKALGRCPDCGVEVVADNDKHLSIV